MQWLGSWAWAGLEGGRVESIGELVAATDDRELLVVLPGTKESQENVLLELLHMCEVVCDVVCVVERVSQWIERL